MRQASSYRDGAADVGWRSRRGHSPLEGVAPACCRGTLRGLLKAAAVDDARASCCAGMEAS